MNSLNILSYSSTYGYNNKVVATASTKSSFENKHKKCKQKYDTSKKRIIAFEKKRSEKFKQYFEMFKENIIEDIEELDKISKEICHFDGDEDDDDYSSNTSQSVDIVSTEVDDFTKTKKKHDDFFEAV